MDKELFAKLKVADIKALFETEQALELLSLAQEDTRSSVQKLAASYIKRQEKELKEPDGIYRVGCHMLERSSVRSLNELYD